MAMVATMARAERKQFVEFTSYRADLDVRTVDLHDDVWNAIKPYKQILQEQFLEEPKPAEVGVTEVLVQSIHDGEYIAFRLIWRDATKDDEIKLMNFSDGASIQFPVSKDAVPEFFMGESDKAVYIMYWKAWRSRDKESGFQTTKTAYPNMTSDLYTFDYVVEGEGTEKTQAEKDLFIPGRAAKNPVSFSRKGIVVELSSAGPGTIESKKVENASGEAGWENGEWTVIFRRALSVNDQESCQFKVGKKMPIAFAVWEGSRMETGGRKAVSPAWAEVEVEE